MWEQDAAASPGFARRELNPMETTSVQLTARAFHWAMAISGTELNAKKLKLGRNGMRRPVIALTSAMESNSM